MSIEITNITSKNGTTIINYTYNGNAYYRKIDGYFTGDIPLDLSNTYADGYFLANSNRKRKITNYYITPHIDKPVGLYFNENLDVCWVGENRIYYNMYSQYEDGTSSVNNQIIFNFLESPTYNYECVYGFPIFLNEEDATAYVNDPTNENLIKKAITYRKPIPKNSSVSISDGLLLARRRILLSKLKPYIDNGGTSGEEDNYCKVDLQIGDIATYKHHFYLQDCDYFISLEKNTEYIIEGNAVIDSSNSSNRFCMYLYENTSTPSGYGLEYLNIPQVEFKYTSGEPTGFESAISLYWQPEIYNKGTSVILSDISFETNIPIFSSYDEANNYRVNGTGIENAINYNKVYKDGIWVSV